MRKWRKSAALALVLMMAASTLAGCGGNGETKTETAKTEAAKTEPTATEAGTAAGGDAKETAASTGKVEFWNDKFINMEQGDVNKIFDSIGSLSGIGVEPVTYPDTAAYQTAMQQSIRGEEAPGLFTWWSGPQLETLAKNGLLEDLTRHVAGLCNG